MGNDQGVPSQETGDQEVAVAVHFLTWVPLNIQTPAIEQRLPTHNF